MSPRVCNAAQHSSFASTGRDQIRHRPAAARHAPRHVQPANRHSVRCVHSLVVLPAEAPRPDKMLTRRRPPAGGPSSPSPKRVTLRTLVAKYQRGDPISMVTAYDYPSAVHVRPRTPCQAQRTPMSGPRTACQPHRPSWFNAPLQPAAAPARLLGGPLQRPRAPGQSVRAAVSPGRPRGHRHPSGRRQRRDGGPWPRHHAAGAQTQSANPLQNPDYGPAAACGGDGCQPGGVGGAGRRRWVGAGRPEANAGARADANLARIRSRWRRC